MPFPQLGLDLVEARLDCGVLPRLKLEENTGLFRKALVAEGLAMGPMVRTAAGLDGHQHRR